MSKKRKAGVGGGTSPSRTRLPQDMEARLQAVWQQLGHLMEWCDSAAAWMQSFCAEPRPYRELFYWESVARMVSEYLTVHPAASPQSALTDCLIATQCPPVPGDRGVLLEFHDRWQEILQASQAELDSLMQRDLELARQEGVYQAVADLYAADRRQ